MPWNMETPLEDGRQNLAAATCDAPAPAAGYRVYAIGGNDGRIPDDARTGDIFLVNVAAHYPAARRRKEAIVEYLEVIYVK